MPALAETVRISTAKLDALLLQAEEMLSVKLSLGQHLSDLRVVMNDIAHWKKEWSKFSGDTRTYQHSQKEGTQLNEQKLTKRKYDKLIEFLDYNHEHVRTFESKLTELTRSSEHDHRFFSGLIQNLLENMKLLLMLPFTSLLQIIPKIIRDLSRDQGKETELEILGSEIEIDKRILEEMKDPLIHIIRNCIDHGIEKPDERKRLGKPSSGKVTVAISRVNSSKVEILVSDDGAGIDTTKLRDAAAHRGILSKDEAEKLSENQALSLVFMSDFSTSSIITDISGRGLGLSIVKEKVEKLGGMVSLDTRLSEGTSFRVVLPLTLASFRGIQVEVGDQIFVVPTMNVDSVLRLKKEEVKTVENLETIPLNGRAVSLVHLNDLLGLPPKVQPGKNSDYLNVMVLGADEKRVAFVIDSVLDELEVLVKGLGKQLTRVPNIAGATVLGSGQVVPILNVTDLMKSAVSVVTTPVKAAEAAEVGKEARNSILIVEDSITSRTLLRNILESAGYRVKTTVDGADGFATLKTEDFDLVVADIQMPRMDGFELTEKIRADKKLADLPVVLVTGLETREDKERGIDAGANAYIVKSTFDKSNLLEVIERLI